MTWLPSFEWLRSILSLNVLLIVLTFGTAVVTFLWQHHEDLKNPRSWKSITIIGTCLLAGIVSITNAVSQDRDSAAKDQQLGFLASEITGYKTAILSQAIRADSKPVHAMFVFHAKGLDYNRGLKDIDFEPDDPNIKLFFRQAEFESGNLDLDINTLFRYEMDWSTKHEKGANTLIFGGLRSEVWDRMGFANYGFSSECDASGQCDSTIDPDGSDGDKPEFALDYGEHDKEGGFGSIGAHDNDVYAISLSTEVTWSDVVRAVGAPFQSSWYGKGAYGAFRINNVTSGTLPRITELLSFQDLYLGFEFLSDPKKPSSCTMARLPIKLEFWRFEKSEQSNKVDRAAFKMMAASPSLEIVDCADHGNDG